MVLYIQYFKEMFLNNKFNLYMKSSDAKAFFFKIFFFNDDFYQTCIFKFSNFT